MQAGFNRVMLFEWDKNMQGCFRVPVIQQSQLNDFINLSKINIAIQEVIWENHPLQKSKQHALYKLDTQEGDMLKRCSSQDIPIFVFSPSLNKSTHAPVLYAQPTGAVFPPAWIYGITWFFSLWTKWLLYTFHIINLHSSIVSWRIWVNLCHEETCFWLKFKDYQSATSHF